MNNKMRVLGIIPARGGSKRLPGKNKKILAGNPLIQWVIEAALASKRLDKIVISSDDNDILNLASKFTKITAIKRPEQLAGDKSPAIEYVHHALRFLEEKEKDRFDVTVILQPTSPLTRPGDIDATVELLLQTGADTAVSVMQLDHAIHPAKLKIMNGDKLLPYLEEENGRMAAHELPEIYVRNCAVYATKREVIDKDLIIGQDCRGYVMPRKYSVDINDELDFFFAEFLMQKLLKGENGL